MPQYSWFRYSELLHPERNGSVLDLLWFQDSVQDYDITTLPLDKHYRGSECASMRSAWGDPDALIVGFQAGQNHDGAHRHLDLGSFILDALGERWAIDSGVERETYLRHLNKRQRWEFYRVRAEGHNTLVIRPDQGPDQELDAFAAIDFKSTSARAVAATDLSQAYAGRARRVRRTLSLLDRTYVVVADEVESDTPTEIWWFLHTKADIELNDDRRIATLHQNGKRLFAQIDAPAQACFEVMDASPLPTSPNPKVQADNQDRRKLAIHLQNVTDLRLAVRLTPDWTQTKIV
jgi:hypothetical protein